MWHVFPCSNVRTVFRTHRQERWLDCMCLKKNFCSNCRESPQWPPKQMASRQALLGKETQSRHWAKLACSGVAGTSVLITVNCQDRLMSGGHGFELYRSQRCWLIHCICKKECWRFANNAFFGSWRKCIIYFIWQVFPCSNCSDCLSHAQARTVTWLHVPQEKTSVPIAVKVPSGRQSKWLLF